MQRRKYATLVAALLPLAAASAPTAVAAITDNWTDGTGNWSTPANWSANLPPAAGDTVNITFTSGSTRNVAYDYTGPNITLNSLNLDLSGSPFVNAILTMNANNLTASNETIGIGSLSSFDGAVFAQSGGTNTVTSTLTLGSGTNGKGSYNLTAGTLIGGDEHLGLNGTGVFTQTGGNNTLNSFQQLVLGYNASGVGVYSLSAGTLTDTGNETVGYAGNGTFNHSGGTNTISSGSQLFLGFPRYNGTYNCSKWNPHHRRHPSSDTRARPGRKHQRLRQHQPGTPPAASAPTLSNSNITTPNIGVGGSAGGAGGKGVFNLNTGGIFAGSIQVYDTPGSVLNLNGGSIFASSFKLQNNNPALFNWTSGTLNLPSAFFLNDTTASALPHPFTLGPNQFLCLGGAYIGDTGSGTFTLNGGNLAYQSVNGLVIGGFQSNNSAASGTFNFNGGTITNFSDGPVVVGNYGIGNFNQTAGTLTNPELWVGNRSSSTGNYNQSNGSLSVSTAFVGYFGTGTYTLSAGNATFDSLIVGDNSGSHGTFNQTGGTISTNSLSIAPNPGSTGTFILSGATLLASSISVGLGGTGQLSISNNGFISTTTASATGPTPPSFQRRNRHTNALNFLNATANFHWNAGSLALNSSTTWDGAASPTSTSAAFGSAHP